MRIFEHVFREHSTKARQPGLLDSIGAWHAVDNWGDEAMMRWLAVILAMFVAACSDAGRSPGTVADTNVGYDLSKDPNVAGQYLVSGAYVDGVGVNANLVNWQTLRNGVEAVRKEGYDLVLVSGPRLGGLIQSKQYISQGIGSVQRGAQYNSITYVVRGYRSDAAHPVEARPIGAAMDQINYQLEKSRAN